MSSLETIEPIYVVDTHALIWYLTKSKKVTSRVKRIFQAAETTGRPELVISAIVIAEMYWVDKKWNVFASFERTYADLKARPYIKFVDFTPDVVLDFDRDIAVPEMHDRIIVGLARRLNVPLISSDAPITAAKLVNVVW